MVATHGPYKIICEEACREIHSDRHGIAQFFFNEKELRLASSKVKYTDWC